MMKKYYYNIFAALLLVLTAACSVDDYGDSSAFGRKGTPIRLTAGAIGSDGQTRAATDIQSTLFDAGQRMNVYIWSGTLGTNEIWIGNPTLCTTAAESDGKNDLTPDEGMDPSFPQDNSTVSLYGLYPVTATHTSTDFTVLEDQKSDGNYKLSDLMWGGKYVAEPLSYSYYTGLAATLDPIDLFFTHKMAKLIVKVTSEGAGDVTNVALKGVKRTIGFTPLTGILGSSETLDNTGDIVLTAAGNISTNGSACLLPPQTIMGEFLQIETNATGDNVAVFALGGEKTFVSGHVYTLNITIDENNLKQIMTIAEWPADVSTLNVPTLDTSNFQIDDIPDQAVTGSAIEPTITVRMNDVEVDASHYTKTFYNNTNAGYAVVIVTGNSGEDDYKDKSAAKTFYIYAAESEFVTKPDGYGEDNPKTWNGSEQPLCTAGSAKVTDSNPEVSATITYSLNKTGPYTTTIPTATEVGEYYVWYRVSPTATYGGIEPVRVENPTVIQKAATPTITAPTARTLIYNERAQQLVDDGSVADGRLVYSLSENGTYTTSIPTGTNAGTYTVYYKYEGQGHYEDWGPGTVEVTIQKAAGRISVSPTTFTFSGKEGTGTVKEFTIDHDGTGTLSATVSEGSYVESSLSGSKLSLKRTADVTIMESSGKKVTISDTGDDNYNSTTCEFTLTMYPVAIPLSSVKATDAKYLGYMVGYNGYIYPNTVNGARMMQIDGTTLAGIITYLGTDAKNGHGYVLCHDHAGSTTWYGSQSPSWLCDDWNTNHKVTKVSDGTTYTWYLGTKDDYQKAVIANDVINKEWIYFYKNWGTAFDGVYVYEGTATSTIYWFYDKFTATEAGSEVWIWACYHPEGGTAYVSLEKTKKKVTLFGADITFSKGVVPLLSF